MKFDYQDWPAEASEAFPHRKKTSRPTIRLTARFQNESAEMLALIDSGADYCLFPSSLGEELGLDIKSGPKEWTQGSDGQPFIAYFHEITLIVKTHQIQAWVGFAEECPWPLLGHLGFLEYFQVKLDFRRKQLELRPYPKTTAARA